MHALLLTQAKGFLKDYIRSHQEVDLSGRNKADMGPLLGKIMRWFAPKVDLTTSPTRR